jgi:hypothetical protein
VVFDLNRDAESRELIKEFENTRYFRIVGEVHSDEELRNAIVSGRAKVGIKFPPDYSMNLVNGRPAQIQVLIDGSESTTALQVLNSSQNSAFEIAQARRAGRRSIQHRYTPPAAL